MGDDFGAGHRLRDGLLALEPASRTPEVDVIVVGGGISGLATALLLADRGSRVRVLEQAAEPGGNAKSVAWGDLTYAIGAAYFAAPEPGSRLAELYQRVGIAGVKVPKGEVLHDGQLRHGFWDGATHPDAAADLARIRDAWTELLERRYPAIPWDSESWSRSEFERADQMPFDRLLEDLHAPPVLKRFCEHYC
ncbi:MAG TPA: FAD-dependent oxidoreductase [Candidatus Limnocylindria bacterium]|nr:FAD-dependent oxidoreductase [Candidatus Limnocylindria bacterium]